MTEVIIGLFAYLFGASGLGRALDSLDAGDAAGSILELIGDALSCINF